MVAPQPPPARSAPWLRAQVVNKSVVAHMDFAARKEPPGEGTDLLDVDCINFKHQMALPMSHIYTLLPMLHAKDAT